MNPFFPSSTKKQKKQKAASDSPEIIKHQTVNSLDLFKANPKDLKSAALDVGKQSVTTAWEQLLGVSSNKSKSPIPMEAGIEYSPQQIAQIQEAQRQQQEAQEKKPLQTTQEHSKYIQEISGQAHTQRESRESEQRIENLIMELRRLATSVKSVEKAVVLQAIGPGNAKMMKGKYYENFFEWMLLVVQDARRKVEDSGAWLQTMTAKSKKGMAVGKMKKSMNQLMSGERSLSNQTG